VQVRVPEHKTPSQQASPEPPHGSQLPFISQAKPSPHVPPPLPPQQGSPSPPQATQLAPDMIVYGAEQKVPCNPVHAGWPAPPQAGLPVAWQLPAWQVWLPLKPQVLPLVVQVPFTQQLPAPQSLLSQQAAKAVPQVAQKLPRPQVTSVVVQKAAVPF
jgi:hypothetical protein